MTQKSRPFDLLKCARPNILKLQPYLREPDAYKHDGARICLDANENNYGPSLDLGTVDTVVSGKKHSIDIGFLLYLHKYPDPYQYALKEKLCMFKNTHSRKGKPSLKPENLFCGVGADEAIDALVRCFCIPGKDKILTCPPTYRKYSDSAYANDIRINEIPLNVDDVFSLQTESILEELSKDTSIKLVFICSPGNPTGKLIRKDAVRQLLEHPTWNGIVVVDEAYIDFSPEDSSLAEWVLEWPNLVVIQTFSKGFGLAGIRLGFSVSSPEIACLMNNLKGAFNITSPTSILANAALEEHNINIMRVNKERMIKQRERLWDTLPNIPGIGQFPGGTDANFLLVQVLNRYGRPDNATALEVYETMAAKRGVIVRFRGNEPGCTGCLRVTVGTEEEVDKFLEEIQNVLHDIQSRAFPQSEFNEPTM